MSKFKINFTFLRKRTPKRGQVLLLAVLILASVIATGISIAILIINLIRAAESMENSLISTYASRSSMEQALFTVKVGRAENLKLDDPNDPDDLIDRINALPEKSLLEGETTEAKAKVLEAKSEETNQTFFLAKDETKQIDLYDPDFQYPGSLTDYIKWLWISWDNNPCDFGDDYYIIRCDDQNLPPNCCIGRGSEWVEISWTAWDVDLNPYENVNKILISSADLYFDDDPSVGCPEGEGNPCYFRDLVVPLGVVFYQVRVKALYDKIDDLEVRAYYDNYQPADIPARVYIKTLGKYGRTQQAWSASMPWKYPVSGLFDYVIFSEKTLKKTPGNP